MNLIRIGNTTYPVITIYNADTQWWTATVGEEVASPGFNQGPTTWSSRPEFGVGHAKSFDDAIVGLADVLVMLDSGHTATASEESWAMSLPLTTTPNPAVT